MTITTSQIMSWCPCESYPKERVAELVGEGMSLSELLRLDIPPEDRIWVAIEYLNRCDQHRLRCWLGDIVERAVRLHALHYDDPVVSRWARAWLDADGDAHTEDAAWAAARAAAWAAARAAGADARAAGYAARAAAKAAAWAAGADAWDAARAAAWAAAWAAGADAWAAARAAAWAAAGDAAGAAAGVADKTDAWVAESERQIALLLWHLDAGPEPGEMR